jgi:hypothetical protein
MSGKQVKERFITSKRWAMHCEAVSGEIVIAAVTESDVGRRSDAKRRVGLNRLPRHSEPFISRLCHPGSSTKATTWKYTVGDWLVGQVETCRLVSTGDKVT